ncbi:cytochrome P450 [Streptomyces sp. 2132.2]|uniref:cytochrome P450 n=1 Tax=Streptomyces sp. 2132.2 TaxID=2485161 RepID=UPI000F4996E7|nr:cytochrome P450 [Streptomyces sp. 2132.2]ROQ94444.1 cytochrome P450 [Streptomyces sp. 2132.2]
MRTLHEAVLDGLPEDLAPAARSQGGGAAMTGPGTTQSAVSRGQQARAGRAGSVRFAAGRALPLFVRGRGSGGVRPAFTADALRALRARHGGAPVLVRGLSGAVLVLLDRQELRQFYEAGPATAPAPALGAVPSRAAVRAVIAEEARHLTAAATLDLVRARHAVARAARRIVLGGGGGGCDGEGGAGEEHPAGLFGRLRRRGAPEGHTPLGRSAAYAGRQGQVLRAMDAVPATLLRTLLLLAAHPAEQDAAAAEAAGSGPAEDLPRLEACVRECLRLYPAVPDLVRVTRTETEWRGVRHPAGTTVLLPAHFHQRDPEHVPAAHVFVPGRWKTPGADEDLRMAPFGHGPGRCPGDRIGLLITTALCAEVLRRRRITATRPVLDPPGPLPVALDPRGIRLTLTRR